MAKIKIDSNLEPPLSPPDRGKLDRAHRPWVAVYLILTLIVGYFTYLKDYQNPPHLFWDENYHIASAQKYLDGVFFMEPHPPLGKLLIALGEYWLRPNAGKNLAHFLTTDHIKTIPEGYSFRGVRLVPTVMAWLTGGLLYLALYFLTLSPHVAFVFACLYNFDTALILHSRSAMLEGSQLFFIIGSLSLFLYLFRRNKPIHWSAYLIFSLLISCAMAVKVNTSIMLLFYPVLFYFDQNAQGRRSISQVAKEAVLKGGVSLSGILSIFLICWGVHFSLCTKVVENRWYGASPEYKEILAKGTAANWANYSVMLRDSYNYFANYQKGVPKLDICKSGENGSYPLGWTVGVKSINYRWEKTNDGRVRYLFLQSNPVVWFTILGGVILSCALVLARLVFRLPLLNRNTFQLILVFLFAYLAYIATMMKVDRVMYLYHYFIPFLFGIMLCALLFTYLFEKEISENDRWVNGALALIVFQILLGFFYFAPFAYYEPLSTADVWRRAWLSGWKLEPVL